MLLNLLNFYKEKKIGGYGSIAARNLLITLKAYVKEIEEWCCAMKTGRIHRFKASKFKPSTTSIVQGLSTLVQIGTDWSILTCKLHVFKTLNASTCSPDSF